MILPEPQFIKLISLSDRKKLIFSQFSDIMCGSFTCSKNTLVGLNVIYILVSFLMMGVAVHSE